MLIYLTLLLASGSIAAAQVYKWVDDKGVVHYTDKPPSKDSKPAKLPPLHTYKPEGSTEPASAGMEALDGTPAEAPQITLVSPTADQTFHAAEGTVPVSVQTSTALFGDQRLMYFLDGASRSPPIAETSFTLTGVERGTHTVSVALVDSAGNELSRSAAVTFHMQPPTILEPFSAPQPPLSSPRQPAAPKAPTVPKPPPPVP
ncbi:MAG: DUF4124 domain-containing protein [Nevskiales bacterium]|nr:DUF4124 domain-containing protein [Nevskiales bacterium]